MYVYESRKSMRLRKRTFAAPYCIIAVRTLTTLAHSTRRMRGVGRREKERKEEICIITRSQKARREVLSNP